MTESGGGSTQRSGDRDGVIAIAPGAPARATAVGAPIVAVSLVAWRAMHDGLRAAPDDPVSPWVIAVLTVVVGAWLGWRALTQWTELRRTELCCRNLVSRFAIDWDRVESLVVLRRGPIVAVDVRIHGYRRRLRLGAATRFGGDGADAVLDMFRAHPEARRLLLDPLDDREDGETDDRADGRADRPLGDQVDDRVDRRAEDDGSGPDSADH